MSEILGTQRDSYSGDVILQNLEMGTRDGFGHVAKGWLEQCQTFDQGLERLSAEQEKIEDITAPLKDWEPVISGGVFRLKYKDGRMFTPTEHCYTNFAYVGNMGYWALQSLTKPVLHTSKRDKTTGEKAVVYRRDSRDAEVLKDYVKVHMFQRDRVNMDKPRLWRTWNDGTLRALLSDRYTVINNLWYLELLKKLIPGGMLSHWGGDADTIYGNVLIPDTIREERDSDYGGMLHVGNSEIGIRRLLSRPSVFRAICLNGCIWDREDGKDLSKVHRGKKLDLTLLAEAIKSNLQSQIPLLGGGIDAMLATRSLVTGDTPLRNIFALVAKEQRFRRSDTEGVMKSFHIEEGILGPDARTAFGLQAALTRFGKTLGPEGQYHFDVLGGKIVKMGTTGWERLLKKAAMFDDSEVEEILAA